jgi:pimeloyl-ACP methyl ester carboxylesterase
VIDPIVAPRLDPAVAAALDGPGEPEERVIEAAGIPFHALVWGEPEATPVVLVHGITSSARTWWRVGPAIAAAGCRVIAPDLPGHGHTGHWIGHPKLADTAADLVAFSRAILPDAEPATVRVVGHSWGAMTAAWLPAVGFGAGRIVLLDPPALTLATLRQILADPSDRRYDDVNTAMAVLGRVNPTWAYGDVAAKAEALTQFDEPAVRAILTENGDWDAGLAALADPAARDVQFRVIRGDPAAGGMIPDALWPGFIARVGAEHVATIRGGPHSPQRTHAAETTCALLHALFG